MGEESSLHSQSNIVQHNIRELLDQSLPNQIAQMEESTINLERVAAYCEANYIQSQNKAEALAETKRYTLQSLASVAYLVGELSRSLLHALELEQVNLAQKTGEIQNLNQLVAIQKEKEARREIGKMTTAKNIVRQNKITYPATEERAPRYQRTAIDFSILDGIGHGRRAPATNNEYGSIGYAATGHYGTTSGAISINRTGSTTSGESGGAGSGSVGSGTGIPQAAMPIYEHYARTGTQGTLTRGSIRSALGNAIMHDQYRVPQAIPSSLPQPNQHGHGGRSHYQSMMPMMGLEQHHQQQQQQQQQRYASTMGLNGSDSGATQIILVNNNISNNGATSSSSNNHYDYEQYGTLRAAQQPQQGIPYNTTTLTRRDGGTASQHQNANGMTPTMGNSNLHPPNSAANQLNISADYSDDGLPLPPPLLMGSQQRQQPPVAQDDGFPMPPPPHPQMMTPSAGGGGGSNGQRGAQPPQQVATVQAEWIPQQYIEKAYVLYDYESRNPDELRLYQGAMVYVVRKNEDGWFEGVMDGITGLFPGNYVQPY